MDGCRMSNELMFVLYVIPGLIGGSVAVAKKWSDAKVTSKALIATMILCVFMWPLVIVLLGIALFEWGQSSLLKAIDRLRFS